MSYPPGMARKRTRTRSRKRARKARTTSTALAPRRSYPIAVHAPARRRSSRGGGGGALLPKEMIGAFGAAVILGVLEAKGVAIPHFGAVGEAGSLAIVGFAAERLGVVPASLRGHVRNGVVGLGSIALYDLAKQMASGGGKVTGHVTAYDVR